MKEITKEMLIGDVVRQRRDLTEVFMDNGMHCVGCPSAQAESIEEACMVHGLNIENLLDALNK